MNFLQYKNVLFLNKILIEIQYNFNIKIQTTMAKNAVEATDDNFSALIASEKVTLVDFWAEWCGPCQMLGPVVEELAGEYLDKAIVAKLDVDANPNISAQFGVRSIPTLLFFKGGELVKKMVGVQPKSALAEALDTL